MKIPEVVKKHFTLKRWIAFAFWSVLMSIAVLPATTQARYGAEPLTSAPVVIAIVLLLGCGIFIPGDWDGKVIRKGEGKQTILFALSGYALTWLWAIFAFADIHYIRENGMSWQITLFSVGFGAILTLFAGCILPLLCFWFKFYRWKLAWGMMFAVFVGVILYVAWRENNPERIFQNRFGRFCEGVRLEAMAVNPSSYEVYKLSSDTGKIQAALQALFPGVEQDLSSQVQYLPEFMHPVNLRGKLVGWNYSIYVWTWSDGQSLYIWFYLCRYDALDQWERMLRETNPEAKP